MSFVLRRFRTVVEFKIKNEGAYYEYYDIDVPLTCRGKRQWLIRIDVENISGEVQKFEVYVHDVNDEERDYENSYCKMRVLNHLGNKIWEDETDTSSSDLHNSFDVLTRTLLLEKDCDKLVFFFTLGSCYNANPPIFDINNRMIASHQRMFENGILTDCTIMSNGMDFQCHKFVLASQSEYFRAMFELDMKEGRSNVVDWKNIFHSDTVQDLLHYFYTNKMPTGIENTYDQLIEAAGLCMLGELKNMCGFVMSQIITVEIAAKFLQLAEKHDLYTLKESAVDFILDNYKDVSVTVGWETIEPRLAKSLLNSVMSIVSSR